MVQRSRGITRTEQQVGRLLVEGGFINKENLDDAISYAQQESIMLRKALVAKEYIADETYSTFLSIRTRIPLVDLRQVTVSEDAVGLVPEDLARQHNALPLMIEGDSLRVAMDDPQDTEAINTLATVTGYRIRPRLPTQGSVEGLLEQHYRTTGQIMQQLGTILTSPGETSQREADARPGPAAATAASPGAEQSIFSPDEVARAPVVQALEMIINQAVKERVSDIHVEPTEENVKVRYRIDGVLHSAATLPKGVQSALISRIKVLGRMDIAERRKPQDGHFNLKVEAEEVDFLVATIDTSHGEKVVMRILNKSTSVFSQTELGLQPDVQTSFDQLLYAPFGMVLVSGPTGSGKTTTLYSSLSKLDASALNIMTIEDPIEYGFPGGVNQTQVNEQAGISFATGLRGIMRLDPDVILVGEIRDQETASVAAQAALTGHLVLTSIHAK